MAPWFKLKWPPIREAHFLRTLLSKETVRFRHNARRLDSFSRVAGAAVKTVIALSIN